MTHYLGVGVATVVLVAVGCSGDPFGDGDRGRPLERGNSEIAYLNDFEREVVELQVLAAQGNLEAQARLGMSYDTGRGVPEDNEEALRWYRLAAEQGDIGTQIILGLMYSSGDGVSQDYAEAVRWFRLAAEQGNRSASFELGIMYADGRGIQKDGAEAARWYRLAADQGHAEAQFNLGRSYAIGQGVPEDYVQAYMWFNLAASRLTGDTRDRAVRVRDVVANRMTAEDLSKAQALAREWDATHPE